MARISKEQQELVRERLIASAARHFAVSGFEGANINQISLDAGLAKGTVYNYFATKRELFAAVLEVGSEDTVALYKEMSPTDDTASKLEALLEADVALTRRHEDFVKVLARELLATDADTRDLIDSGLEPLLACTETILREGRARGEVRRDRSAQQLADHLISLVIMLYVQHWRTRDRQPSWTDIPALTVDLFLNGAATD
ncbi:MAG: TetR/AcrR family transcriptional regulator [Pseudomonadota bacterium]